jgi:hypothetical protein
MLRDITFITVFLILVVALSQLRFSRYRIATTLLWSFIILMGVILVMQTMKFEFYYQTKNFLDAVFWVSFGGMLVAYLWIKRFSKTER